MKITVVYEIDGYMENSFKNDKDEELKYFVLRDKNNHNVTYKCSEDVYHAVQFGKDMECKLLTSVSGNKAAIKFVSKDYVPVDRFNNI